MDPHFGGPLLSQLGGAIVRDDMLYLIKFELQVS